ncbi:MAG: hypothetical protein M3P08_16050 [Thermoproteota archaeon]|nr:hypothetical protein [Thermoproteota archaeon]
MTEIEDFVQYMKQILGGLEYDIDFTNKDKYFKFHWEDQHFISFPNSILEPYNNALNLLKKKSRITNRAVSEKHVEDMFGKFLFRD